MARKQFIFDEELKAIGDSIKNEGERLRFYEAIINMGINDVFPSEADSNLARGIFILGKSLHISDVRSDAGKKGGEKKAEAMKGNKNAQKENTSKRAETTTQTQLAEKKQRNQKKRDENIELIETIKGKVESLGLVYKGGDKERINATNIRTSKQFKLTAERFNLSCEQLALAVIDASMSDKFRSGKINNCEMVYRYYAKIINQTNMNSIQNSVGYLPGA